MEISTLLILLLSAPSKTHCYTEERSILDSFIEPFRIFKNSVYRAYADEVLSEKHQKALQQKNKWQTIINASVEFPCSTKNFRSEQRPNSIHRLKLGDIDVIGAIGDSVTAGFGLRALSSFQVFYENRELSFSGGGFATWRECLTLPNILKEFNPNLIGYVKNFSLTTDSASEFNVAEGGAISSNMPYMTKILVQRIKNDPRVDVERDWKMITLMIGNNDFCLKMCYHKNPESVIEQHRIDLLEVLRHLKDNLPRTIVNLIPPPTVEKLHHLKNKPPMCNVIFHSLACPCVIGLVYAHMQDRFTKIMKRWQQIEIEVADLEEFQTDDFAVVIQPMFLNLTIPTLPGGGSDFSYLSEDCFHFSQKGFARIANSLWNNMLQPVGNKSTDTTEAFTKFLCPTKQHPYIFTKGNSK